MRNLLTMAVVLLIFTASAENATVVTKGGYLNGRERPNKHAAVSMRIEPGDTVDLIEIDGKWASVKGGECGVSYVSIDFITQSEAYRARNSTGGRVRIRSTPDGKAVGWLKTGKTVTVERTLRGWGYIGTGWVSLDCLEEVP